MLCGTLYSSILKINKYIYTTIDEAYMLNILGIPEIASEETTEC